MILLSDCVLVQVPTHVGLCHPRLMRALAVHVANLRNGVAWTSNANFDDVVDAARAISEGTVTLYKKCRVVADGYRTVYYAAPSYRREGEAVRERFDFVEERAELWKYDRRRNACRPVVQLRGFVYLDLGGDETYNVAIARNLKPHPDVVDVDEDGNPWHPRWGVFHCLWEFDR